MAISQPGASDNLDSPSHSLQHRQIATDPGASIKSVVVDANDNVGVGLEPTANMEGVSIEDGLLTIKERTTPTADANYGKIYTKTDNYLYYQDGAGAEHQIAVNSHFYGEYYAYENEVGGTITTVNQWHAAIGLTEGDLNGFTYDAGASIDVLSFADYSGTVAGTIKATTDGAHGLSTGDPVTLVGPNIAIGGANEYTGIYLITVVDADEYYFTNANWNASTTATSIQPARLIASVGSAGKYSFNGTASVSSPSNSKTFDFKMYINATAQNKTEQRFENKTANTFDVVASSAILTIADEDIIWFGAKGITDDTDILMRYVNVNLTRI